MTSSVPRQSVIPTRGVNIQMDATSIGDDECVRSENLYPARPGGPLQLRPALTTPQEIFWASPHAAPAVETQVWWHERLAGGFVIYTKDIKDTREAIKFYTGDLVPSGASFAVFAVSEAITPPCVVRVNQQAFVMNRAGMWIVDADLPAVGLGAGGDVPTIRPSTAGITPGFAVNVRSRMWYANLGVGKENRIIVSDRFKPEQLPTDALFEFEVGTADEGPITAIVEAAVTDGGSAETNVVIVWKRNNYYVISGEPAQSTDTPASAPDWRLGTLRVSRPQEQCGCVSNRTVSVSQGGVFWLGPDDVWFMPFGSQPIAVGTKIRPAIAQVALAREQWMYGVYIDGTYRVSADASGQAVTQDAQPEFLAAPAEEWWLDCRTPESDDDKGFPRNAGEARWWGPQKYQPIVPSVSIPVGPLPVYYRASTLEDGSIVQESVGSTVWPSDTSNNFAELIALHQVTAGQSYDATLPVYEAQPWRENTTYEEGNIVVPTEALVGGALTPSADILLEFFRVYVCAQGGVSSGADPFTVAGPTVVDGTCLWYVRNSALGTERISAYCPKGRCIPIHPVLITKEYDFGDDVVNKLIQGLEVVHSNESALSINVTSIIDREAISLVMTLPSTVSISPLASELVTGNVAGQGQRRFQLDYLPLDNGGVRRIVGRTVQLTLSMPPYGVLIDAGNDRFNILVGAVNYLVTIPQMLYPSMLEVIAAIQVALNALGLSAISVNFTDFGFVTFFDSLARTMVLGPAPDAEDKLFELLGFDISFTHVAVIGGFSVLTGTHSVFLTRHPVISLKSINARIRPFTRRAN